MFLMNRPAANQAPATMSKAITFSGRSATGTHHVNLNIDSHRTAYMVRDNTLTIQAILPEGDNFQINVSGAGVRSAQITPALYMGGFDVYVPAQDSYIHTENLQDAVEVALGL